MAYLELIMGPMFSGKTSKLLEIYKQCMFCNIKTVVVNHDLDKRYHSSMLSTHDKIMIPCIRTTTLELIWDSLQEADVILINEGQFFPDLYESCIRLMYMNKKVYVCGLDGDFQKKPIGQMLELIPICDNVTKLTSLCAICKNGTRGIFSKRVTGEQEQIIIGADNYIPVCRICYTN